MLKQHLRLRHRMTCSNLMRYGVLSRRKSKRDGCGQPCAAEPAKSSLLSLEIEVKRPAFGYGRLSRMNTSIAIPSVTFGLPINTCSRLKPTTVLGKKLERLRIWNAGTTLCVNASAAMLDQRCPFLSPMSIIVLLLWHLSFSTIWAYHLPLDHYPSQNLIHRFGPCFNRANW